MQLKSVSIKNFRCIAEETLQVDQLTALVGRNGTGKSTFLNAIDAFYNPSPKIEIEDYYNNDTSKEIVISITFDNLSPRALELFSIYLQNDLLSVEKVFKYEEGKIIAKYHGATLQCPAFDSVKAGYEIKDRAKTARTAYDELRKDAKYESLPEWTTIGDSAVNLKNWEADNPNECIWRRDEGQFFGFRQVGRGYLGRFTNFLFIPAVRNASDDTTDTRGSVLSRLMDMVVRSVLANKEEVKKLKEDTQKRYEEIMDPANLTELSELEEKINQTLKTFVPDASISMEWDELSDIEIPMPQAQVKLIEDGYPTAVFRTGHGLQRAFILTMLQHLAMAQSIADDLNDEDQEESTVQSLPNLIIGIEEPELYQHPNRQRYLFKMLDQLSKGVTLGVAEKTQIIYATHSPLFVSVDRIEQIRVLRKVNNGSSLPRRTIVIQTNLDEIAESIWVADDKPVPKYSGSSLLPRLKAIMNPFINEGFFSDVIVLVEGEDDRAAILGSSYALDLELEGQGISVIPCGGKSNIDRPFAIFRALGLDVYPIWDGDYGKGETSGKCEKCERPLDGKADPNENRKLLRLLGHEPVEDWPELVNDKFACFKINLETQIKDEIGSELFEKLLLKYQREFGILKRKYALKNPYVISKIIEDATKEDRPCNTIKKIIGKFISLR